MPPKNTKRALSPMPSCSKTADKRQRASSNGAASGDDTVEVNDEDDELDLTQHRDFTPTAGVCLALRHLASGATYGVIRDTQGGCSTSSVQRSVKEFVAFLVSTADRYVRFPKSEAEVGIIEQVSLKNFMCHTRLEFKFCPQVNFIIGQNGSGKSAVLTSIVIGLGGKANVTNRGTSVKGFIKSGKQSAEVIVKLRNQGQDAYKADVYGPSIIVERRLTKEGSNSYKIKRSDGMLVSTKREELNHILDSFNIQVDNPVAVLNQDCSRNFLNSKNAQDKYKFFLKATQLEQLKHDYVMATDAKEFAMEVLAQKQQTMPTLEREVMDLEEQYKASKAVSGLHNRVKALKDEQAWAIIAKAEKELDTSTKEVQKEDARTPAYADKVTKHDAELTALKTERTDLHAQIEEICHEATALEGPLKEAKKTANESKGAFRNAQLEVRKVKNEFTTMLADHKAIQDRIEEIKNTAQQDYETERLRREQKIGELAEMIATLMATHQTTEHETEQFKSAVTADKELQYKVKADEHELSRQRDRLQRELHDLGAARQNRMKRFGHWMPDLLKQIEIANNKGLFRKKPRGPLGSYLELMDPKWALAVESCLKALIHAFAVHDHHDERELENIFARICPDGRKPASITSTFMNEQYDVSQYRPQTQEYPSVLDVLRIKDPVVANCLIDQRSIENVLLIEKNDQARQVMMHAPPCNVREAFTVVGDHIYAYPTFRYYSNNAKKANILTSSVEETIKFNQERLTRIEADHHQLLVQQRELGDKIAVNVQKGRACDTRLMKIRTQLSNINLELTELKEKEDPAPVDITTLEEEAEQIRGNIQVVEERRMQVEAYLVEKTDALKAHDEAFKNIGDRLSHLADSTEPYKEKRAQLDDKIEDVQNLKKHYVNKKKEHAKKLIDLRAKHDTQKAKLVEDVEKANQFCPRISTRRSPDNIECEIRQIQKQVTKQEKTRGNHEEIARKYHELKESYKNIMTEVNQLNNFLKAISAGMEVRRVKYIKLRGLLATSMKQKYILQQIGMRGDTKLEVCHKLSTIHFVRALDGVMEHRQTQYFEFRKMIAVRVKYFFILMLSNRNYTGKLTFNHQKELLTMSVTPSTGDSDGAKDMKSLSGGERSFATVCFILALWDTMESPFRCLDEFDVFMDLVNRRIATQMMLDVASQQKGRQFIFLTPLELSSMNFSRNIKVYRMPDPDRGQGTLGFKAVEANKNAENPEEEEKGEEQ